MRTAWPLLLAVVLLPGIICPQSAAGTYELSNGQIISGEPIAPDPDGVVIKTGASTFTPRIAWTNFTENALRTLAQDNPKARSLVANLIYDEPEIEEAVVVRPEVRIQSVARIAPPGEMSGLLSLFASPIGLVLFALMYGTNIYAGYVIGVFRTFNPVVVAGVSAILPLVGPLIFLVLPSGAGSDEEYEDEDELEEAEQALAEQAVAPAPAEDSDIPVAVQERPKAIVYERGKFTFNRRFFETKLASFLRVVPSEEDKDLVLEIDSLRGHHVGTRVTKILPTELHLQVKKGDASTDVLLPFSDIKSVTIRHKGV